MTDVYEILLQASKLKRPIRIIYHGGNQPGKLRGIIPISIKGDDVKAICMATKVNKTFKLPKIELTNRQERRDEYIPNLKKEEPASLVEGVEPLKKQLKELGWILHITEDSVNLYRQFKNGKLRKTPDVFMHYYKYTESTIDWDEDGNQFFHKKLNTRPWYVRSNTTETAYSFGKLSSALERFFSLANNDAESLKLKD